LEVEPPTRDPIHTLVKHPNYVKGVSGRDEHTVAGVEIPLSHLFERSCLLDPACKRLRDGSQCGSSETCCAVRIGTSTRSCDVGLPGAPRRNRLRAVAAVPNFVPTPPIRSLSENLCRGLCRNPAIPTHIGRLQLISLCHKQEARKMRRTRINRASLCHSDFFGVASSRTVSRFDTVEVCGSSPHGPTIHLTESIQ
jgi:hypothetical protein